MNIIIEGPEAVGKTTLANKLKEKYKMNYEHLSSKTKNDYEFHKELLEKNNCIFDRFFLGELIYPKLYNREAKLNFNEALQLMNKIVENGDIFIVFFTSNINVLKERIKERGNNELKYLEEIEEQNKLFLQFGWIFEAYEYDKLLLVDVSKEENYKYLDDFIEHYKQKEENNDMNKIYKKICEDLLIKGENVNNTTEINNYCFTLNDVNNSIVTLKSRNISIPYITAELMWYWSGRNDVDFIGKFASLWKKISDDGKTNNSAYGYLLQEKHGFNQIEKVIELLKEDSNSRRAVVNINVPNENVIETKDEPCTICLQFYIRNNKLCCTAIMRSNDVYFGLTYDVIYFTQLQKYIAKELNVEVGNYTHFATSMHFYERDRKKIEKIANGDLSQIDYEIDLDKLLENNNLTEIINYVDNNYVDKETYQEELEKKDIVRKRRLKK